MLDEPEGIVTFTAASPDSHLSPVLSVNLLSSTRAGLLVVVSSAALCCEPGPCYMRSDSDNLLRNMPEEHDEGCYVAVMQRSSNALHSSPRLLHTLSTVPAHTPNRLLSVYLVSVNSLFGNKVVGFLFFLQHKEKHFLMLN